MKPFPAATQLNTISANAAPFVVAPNVVAPNVVAPNVVAPNVVAPNVAASSAPDLDLDNFIDFYALLQMPLSSTESELRKQITTLYLEAQKNQDHRNAQKKMFFQQMYEAHLPRARYLLLFPGRRLKYDEHVRTFREDRAQQLTAPDRSTTDNETNAEAKTKAKVADAPVLEVEVDEVDEEILTVRREILWKQWQESLDVAREAPQLRPLVFTPQQAVREQTRNTFMRETSIVVREEERLRREESLRRQQKRWEDQAREENEARLQIQAVAELEEQRKQAAVARAGTARRSWSMGSGAALFAVGSIALFATASGNDATAASEVTQSLSQAQRPFHNVPFKVPGTVQAEDYDLGMESTAYHKITPAKDVGSYRPGSGVVVTSTNSGYAVTGTASGEWIEYSIDVAQSGNYDLGVDVASQNGGGAFRISSNGQDKTGDIAVPATGSYDAYQAIESKVALASGKQIMRLTFRRAAADGSAGNFDAISFRALPSNATGSSAFVRLLLWLVLALFSIYAGIGCGSLAEKRRLAKTK